MGQLYKCSAKVIQRFAKEIGYVNTYRKTLTEQEKKEVIDQYYTCKADDLAKKYNVSKSLITKTWRSAEIKDKKGNYVYPFDIDYFENIDTPDKAYFLGLLAADGNVFKRSNNDNTQAIIKLGLQYEDRYILEIFKEYILSKKPLHIHSKQNESYINYFCELELVSNKMMNDLSKYNITPRKTYDFITPDLDDKLMSHYIRGYFDGDGCITVSDSKYHTASSYTCSISGYKNNLEKIQSILYKQNINSYFIIDQRPDKYTHDSFGRIALHSKKDIENFIKYIYNDCRDLYFSRKKYKCECFLQALNIKYEYEKELNNNINAVLNEK